MKYILPKGFVSVDGCSLTVGEVTDTTFSVYLIPETLRWAPRHAGMLEPPCSLCLGCLLWAEVRSEALSQGSRRAAHPAPAPRLCRPRRVTVAGIKGVGDHVNIEVEAQTQAIVDTVERVLQVGGWECPRGFVAPGGELLASRQVAQAL